MELRAALIATLALASPAAGIRAWGRDATPVPKIVTTRIEQAGAAGKAGTASAPHGRDTIWTGLVYATNVEKPTSPPRELRDFAARLSRVFGYNQFELKGSVSKVIEAGTESMLVPSKNLWLSVRARRAMSKEARGGYLLNVHLYQDERPIVDTEAKLAPGSPLFIRGPACANGHLIIVLQVQQ